MTFSKTTEYALRVMNFMMGDSSRTYSSFELNRELKIPVKYLQRILTGLAKNKLIASTRGRSGGYTFAREARKIFLWEIIHAVEGFKDAPSCFFGFNQCALKNPCAMHDVWSSMQAEMIHTLKTTRLTDLYTKNIR